MVLLRRNRNSDLISKIGVALPHQDQNLDFSSAQVLGLDQSEPGKDFKSEVRALAFLVLDPDWSKPGEDFKNGFEIKLRLW